MGSVRKLLQGKGSSPAIDTLQTLEEDTELTQEEFKQLLETIDSGLRALPATAQVCAITMLRDFDWRICSALCLQVRCSAVACCCPMCRRYRGDLQHRPVNQWLTCASRHMAGCSFLCHRPLLVPVLNDASNQLFAGGNLVKTRWDHVLNRVPANFHHAGGQAGGRVPCQCSAVWPL